jgi:hypothetical protein
MNLTPQIKAQTIAAAIYTSTGIQPIIINRPNQPPLVSFSREDSKKVNNLVQAMMTQKSDVSVDFYPYIAPVILNQLFAPILIGVIGAAALGYLIGKGHPF